MGKINLTTNISMKSVTMLVLMGYLGMLGWWLQALTHHLWKSKSSCLTEYSYFGYPRGVKTLAMVREVMGLNPFPTASTL